MTNDLFDSFNMVLQKSVPDLLYYENKETKFKVNKLLSLTLLQFGVASGGGVIVPVVIKMKMFEIFIVTSQRFSQNHYIINRV